MAAKSIDLARLKGMWVGEWSADRSAAVLEDGPKMATAGTAKIKVDDDGKVFGTLEQQELGQGLVMGRLDDGGHFKGSYRYVLQADPVTIEGDVQLDDKGLLTGTLEALVADAADQRGTAPDGDQAAGNLERIKLKLQRGD